jgi:osmotically-inducible protein OsmY
LIHYEAIEKEMAEMNAKTVFRSNKNLRADVIAQLDWDPEVPLNSVGVAVGDGVVMLTGFVKTYSEKIAAEQAAKRPYGVRAIANDIEIKPEFELTDPEIAKSILHALEAHVKVPDKDITTTVKNGWITLKGEVQWMYQKEAAESAVRYLSGVKRVTNQIKIQPSASPAEVQTKIEEALRRSAEVDARRINVVAYDSKVILSGGVHSWHEKEEAERAAWSPPGVTAVESNITIAPYSG